MYFYFSHLFASFLSFSRSLTVILYNFKKVVDYGNLMILPGLIDSHVHVNEPGRTDWEGFETATKAAAAGGFTTIIDMPL